MSMSHPCFSVNGSVQVLIQLGWINAFSSMISIHYRIDIIVDVADRRLALLVAIEFAHQA
eukprot:scaffold32809_cov47-Cyclotella_meneghiniana.AAC.6